MALLVAFGLMNLWAMVALAAVVLVEKTSAWGVAFGRIAGVVALVLAVLVVFFPALAPGIHPATHAGTTGMPMGGM